MKPVTLGEGNTPLLKLERLSEKLGFAIWAKCEFMNPTGSFKDRGTVTEISTAIKQGKDGVVCASTGNMAASLAAYAARAELTCMVIVPTITPESKLRQALICGARLEKIDGTYDDCVGIAQKIADRENYLLCGDYELRRIGQRSIGRELAASSRQFDSVVVPVGNGTVGIAIMEGLAESEKALPGFIGTQAANANPIEMAWRTKTAIKPIKNTSTIASAFNVGNPLDGQLVLDWLAKTNGDMIAVTDVEIVQAQELLATTEGLFVETTAASTIAGLVKSSDQFQNQTVVVILTGAGLKERR